MMAVVESGPLKNTVTVFDLHNVTVISFYNSTEALGREFILETLSHVKLIAPCM